MSNYLALATVTATIKRILETAIDIDLPGAKVTTLRPGAGGSDIPEVRVNVYLYQAIPSPAWRNSDLRARRPKGELTLFYHFRQSIIMGDRKNTRQRVWLSLAHLHPQ